MAHEITAADRIFVSNNLPAWHGLGTVFEGYPTREEAQAIAHPWEPVEEAVFSSKITATDSGIYEGFSEIENYKAIVRSDTGKALGVVKDTYQLVTNNEMWDIAEALEKGNDDVMFETGGSLRGGSKVWLLLKLKEPLVVPGDPHGASIPYYSLQNAHDGSGSFRGQATMTRIVCANTAHVADLDAKARGTNFTFRHSKNITSRIEEAQVALGLWREGLTNLQDKYQHLLAQKIDSDSIEAFEHKFFPVREGLESDRQLDNIHRARESWRSVLYSETCEGTADTAYGLVQASVEYAEHKRTSHTDESKFKRSFLDESRYVRDAVKIAEAVTLA